MPRRTHLILLTLAAVVHCSIWLSVPDQGQADEKPNSRASTGVSESTDEDSLVTVEVARERALLAHSIYSATLDVVHHYYFRDDTAAVPARAMENLFYRMSRKENISGRWISVNAPAMSIDHKPQDDFEKAAAKAIASGKSEYEQVVDGVYRRAGAISLMDKGCLGCHLQGGSRGGRDRFAGLVISIPVRTSAKAD